MPPAWGLAVDLLAFLALVVRLYSLEEAMTTCTPYILATFPIHVICLLAQYTNGRLRPYLNSSTYYCAQNTLKNPPHHRSARMIAVENRLVHMLKSGCRCPCFAETNPRPAAVINK